MTTPPTATLPPPPQGMFSTATLQLKRGEQCERTAMYYHNAPPQPPATPSAWFTQRFPAEVKRWGCPFLEAVTTNPVMMTTTTQAVALNDNFFAAILSDQQLGHAVIYFEPERGWYFREPRDGQFHPTSEAKLMILLSALLLKCAEELRSSANMSSLFVAFRSEEQLKAVVKKARSLLAADSTFFSATSPHQRVEGPERQDQMARRFIGVALKPQPGHLLSVNHCYSEFAGFCRNHGVEPLARKLFRQLVVDIIREECGVGLRADLKDAGGHYQRGWKGLAVDMGERN